MSILLINAIALAGFSPFGGVFVLYNIYIIVDDIAQIVLSAHKYTFD